MIVALKINVKKIRKELLYAAQSGAVYLDATVFIDNVPDEFGQNGMITQQMSKEEREAGGKSPILGNCKIRKGFVGAMNEGPPQQQQRKAQDQRQALPPAGMDDDDIPF